MAVKAANLLAEGRYRFTQRADCVVRQCPAQVAKQHARLVRGLDLAQLGRRAPGDKITNQLTRRAVVAAAQRVGLRFQLALQHHAGQRVHAFHSLGLGGIAVAQRGLEGARVGREIFRRDADHQCRIGIAFVARVLAHAIGDHALRLRGGRHHGAARAHAKAVHRASVRRVVHEPVFGRAQKRMAGMAAPAGAVDQALRVLDPKADRERLGLDVDAASVQHRKGVARTVAQRQHHLVGAQLLGLTIALVQHRQAAQVPALRSVLDLHIGHALLKAHLAAERDDLLAQVLHDLD